MSLDAQELFVKSPGGVDSNLLAGRPPRLTVSLDGLNGSLCVPREEVCQRRKKKQVRKSKSRPDPQSAAQRKRAKKTYHRRYLQFRGSRRSASPPCRSKRSVRLRTQLGVQSPSPSPPPVPS